MINNAAIVTGLLFGMFAIILGAFGAHALKKIITEQKLASFEIGVRYQLYHSFFLLLMGIGFNANFNTTILQWSYYLVTIGTIFFSLSIYLLSLADYFKKNFKFLGPITPLGGLLMILGWLCLLIHVVNI